MVMKTSKNNMKWNAILMVIFALFNFANASADTSGVLSRSVIVREAKVAKEHKSLSKDCTTISFNDVKYYESKGRYFVESGENYKLVTPPTGIKISKLPKGYSTITVIDKEYYSYRGVVYKGSTSGGYEITNPEIGMTLPDLPEADVREVLIDGNLHYESSGFIYKAVSDGEYYVVICTLESLNA